MKLYGSETELVTIQFRKDSQLITLEPSQSVTYSASRVAQLPPQDANSILVSADSTQTLTNKSMSGSSNTFTNISLTSAVINVLPSANGGTGVNNAGSLTYGSNNITFSTSGTTSLTLPASGTLATLAGSEALSNKTLGNSNTVTLLDTLFTLQDDGDNTKQLRLQLSGISTGTTRTLTVPDASTTIVGTDATQTLTNKTISGASNTITVRLANDVTGILPQANGGTGQNSTATFPASGVVVTEAGTETITNKTISGSSNTLTVLAASQLSGQVPIANGGTNAATANSGFNNLAPSQSTHSGQFLTTDGTNTSWATPAGAQSSASDAKNYTIATSVSGNALTIALKDGGGSDPSAGSPVNVAFRSSTPTSGGYNIRSVSAAASLTLPSGSGIGTESNTASPVYFYALDNAGTVEYAVSSNLFDEGKLQTTTGGGSGSTIAGSAGDQTKLYSVTARPNVPIRLLGKLVSTQTIQGVWAVQPQVTETLVPDRSVQTIAADNTGTTPAVGFLGETTRVQVRFASRVSVTSSTAKTITSVTIQPGTWLITGAVGYLPATTTSVTEYDAAISLTTNATPAAAALADVNQQSGEIYISFKYPAGVPNGTSIVPIPSYIVSFTTATTLFLVANAVFTVSTMEAYGSFSATRIA